MHILRLLAATLIAALSTPALAQAPYLVTDLNTTGAPNVVSSDPFGFVFTGGKTFFKATAPEYGMELWVSDAGGTRLMMDMGPGPVTSGPGTMLALTEGVVLFVANSGVGRELWRSDGTAAGTMLVKDIVPGTGSSSPELLMSSGGRVYFSAAGDYAYYRDVWVSDGTEAGTKLLVDSQLETYTQVRVLTALGGSVFLTANGGLYKTDGTPEGTVMVKSGLQASAGAVAGSNVVLAGYTSELGTELWKSDGTEAGTQLLKDVNPGVSSGVFGEVTTFGSSVIFVGYQQATGGQYWISDGTTAGTRILTNLTPYIGPFDVPTPVVMGSHAYLSRIGTLWRTDGTEAGTTAIATTGDVKWLVAGDTRVFFAGFDSGRGWELWSSGGTAASTGIVADIYPGPISALTRKTMTFAGGKLYFSAVSPDQGEEPWTATEAGSVSLLANIGSDSGPSSSPSHLTAVGDDVFFTAIGDVQMRRDLWRSAGNADDTTLLTPSSTHPVAMSSSLSFPSSFHGRLYFVHPYDQLWQSDGTAAGTGSSQTVAGIPVDRALAIYPTSGFLYLAGAVSLNPFGLARTDGTAAGTRALTSSGPVVEPGVLTEFGGKTYYLAWSSGLWSTEGTEATTRQVRALNFGSVPRLVAANGAMYFAAQDGTSGIELWRSDGTYGGTTLVKDIVPGAGGSSPTMLTAANRQVFFVASDGTNGYELWRSDGTESGTVMVKDIAAGASSSFPSSLVALDSTLYFAVDDGVNGRELWKSDGTEAGTSIVADLAAGARSSYPVPLLAADGRLWFTANDGISGVELWSTDGLTTTLIDVEPGSGSSFPEWLVRAGRRLHFAATTVANGRELWALPLAATAVSVADAHATESAGNIVFTVTRSGDLSASSSVEYATVDGSAEAGIEYTHASGVINFAAGEVTKTVTVPIANDSVLETGKGFLLVLSNSSGAVIASAEATGTIVDDDVRADLSVEYLPSGSPGRTWGPFYIRVTNAGPATASGLQLLFNSTPFYQSVYGATTGSGPYMTCSGSLPLSCKLSGAIAPGAFVTFAFTPSGSPGFADPAQPPGFTVSAQVSAQEPDWNPGDNTIAVMTSADGLLTSPSFLTPGRTNTLMFANSFAQSTAYQVDFRSSLPEVTIDPPSIVIPGGQMSGTTSIRTGDTAAGWTFLSAQSPFMSSPTRMNVPIVVPPEQPRLDTAVTVGDMYAGTASTDYLKTVNVPWEILARRADGVRPTGTISILDSSGSVVQTRTVDAQPVVFSLSGLDPGTYRYQTRYDGDGNFRPVTVPYPVVVIYPIGVSVNVSVPSVLCGTSDVVITVRSTSQETAAAPPGTVSVTFNSGQPVAVELSPTGAAGESRAIVRRTLSPGFHSISASYPGSKYFGSNYAYAHVNVAGVCTPSNVAATATSANQVFLTWQGSGAHYEVMRGTTMSTFALIGVSSAVSFLDTSALAGKTYLYKVRAIDPSGAPSEYSAVDLATTVAMTDNPVVSRSTVIKAAHILELRSAINAVRAAAGLTAQTFEALGPGSPFRAVDITSLRAALIQARDALGMPLAPFTDSSLTGLPVKAIHVEELRNGVR